MVQRIHPAHAVVDVVAVKTDKEHDDCRNGRPEDLQGKIAFDRQAVTQFPTASTESHQAEDHQANDSQKQNRSDTEQNAKQFVVDRCIGTGVNREKVDVLTDPESAEDQDHSEDQGDNGGGDRHVWPLTDLRLWRSIAGNYALILKRVGNCTDAGVSDASNQLRDR